MTNLPAVKRVISKDHMRGEKKSKMGATTSPSPGGGADAARMMEDDSAAADGLESSMMAVVVDEDGNDDDYDFDNNNNNNNCHNYVMNENNNTRTIPYGERGTGMGTGRPLVASASHRSLSQLSQAGDRSTTMDMNDDVDDNPPGGGVGETAIQRRVSDDVFATIHERRGSTSTTGADDSYGWWIEDVHGHDGTYQHSTNVNNAGGNIAGGGKGGNDDTDGHGGGGEDANDSDGGGRNNINNSSDKTSKKKGWSYIGGEIMQSVMSMVEPQRQQETSTMAVTAPTYVLGESLSSQKLWKQTAGNRPPQPVEERAFFEQMWAQNFARSNVKYEIPVEVLTASTPISISPFNDDRFGDDGATGGNLSNYNLAATFNMSSAEDAAADPASVKAAQADAAEATLNQRLSHNGAVQMYFDPNRPKDYNLKTLGPHHHHHVMVNKKVKNTNGENDLIVLVRGDNVFGTTVSKSFPRVNDKGGPADGIDTVSISIASYRVVESKKQGKYAQYLVIFCDGNFRNTVGVWKRYSDFSELSRKVTQGDKSCAAVVTGLSPLSIDDHDAEILPNAITSWRLLKKRQRWYRCLDAGYLSLKVFLLERFLHDILFESSNPQILRDFVGINSSEGSKLNTKG